MKRREHGVNLDDGVPLATGEEFDLLYVDCNPAPRAELMEWFASPDRNPLLLGGQIGSGKTTLLKEIARSHDPITVAFDTGPLEPATGAFGLLLLGRIVERCLREKIDPDGCGVSPADFDSLDLAGWKEFRRCACETPENLDQARKLREACRKIEDNFDSVLKACGELLERIASASGKEPVILAEGIDKFHPNSPDYFLLSPVIAFLAGWKTLFEANAVHMFGNGEFGREIRRLFIGTVRPETLAEVLRKRLGIYAGFYEQELPTLVSFSGGNLRQAVRLLSGYYHHRSTRSRPPEEALARACHAISKDLLALPYRRPPADLITVVKRDGFIDAGLFKGKDAVDALDSLYNNWIFLKRLPEAETASRWPTAINPLIGHALDEPSENPETPEENAVFQWAKEHDLSPVGLNVPRDENGDPDWETFWQEVDESVEKNPLHADSLLEEIASGLFARERQDRVMIVFPEDKRELIRHLRAYLIGKAAASLDVHCKEIELNGGEGTDPTLELRRFLARDDAGDDIVHSIVLTGNWTEEQLRDLDRRRDMFVGFQMLWWMEETDLSRYLPLWPQFRQLFRIYRIADDVFRGIEPAEIEEDIELLESIGADSESDGMRNLREILEYLGREVKER